MATGTGYLEAEVSFALTRTTPTKTTGPFLQSRLPSPTTPSPLKPIEAVPNPEVENASVV